MQVRDFLGAVFFCGAMTLNSAALAASSHTQTKIVYYGKLPCERALLSPTFQDEYLSDPVANGTLHIGTYQHLAQVLEASGGSANIAKQLSIFFANILSSPDTQHPVLVDLAKTFELELQRPGFLVCAMDNDCEFDEDNENTLALFSSETMTPRFYQVSHKTFVWLNANGTIAREAFISHAIQDMTRLDGTHNLMNLALQVPSHFGVLSRVYAKPSRSSELEVLLDLIHEFIHYSDKEFTAQWINANRKLVVSGQKADQYFQKYAMIEGEATFIDTGFLSFFTETRAYDAESFSSSIFQEMLVTDLMDLRHQRSLVLYSYLKEQGNQEIMDQMGVSGPEDLFSYSSGDRSLIHEMKASIERANLIP